MKVIFQVFNEHSQKCECFYFAQKGGVKLFAKICLAIFFFIEWSRIHSKEQVSDGERIGSAIIAAALIGLTYIS